jgi:hypothetical protein
MPKKPAKPKFAEVEEITEVVPPVKQVAFQDGKTIEIETPAPVVAKVPEPEAIPEPVKEEVKVEVPIPDEPEEKESILLPKEESATEEVVKDEKMVEVPKVENDAPLEVEKNTVEEKKTEPDKKAYLVGLFLTVLVTAICFGIFFYFIRVIKPQQSNIAPQTTSTPTPTETVKVFDKSLVTFEILNGSGVVGAAKKEGVTIESLGYKLGKTGNATEQTGNTLYISSDLAEFADTIISDLKDYAITEISDEPLTGSSSARLILGK